MNGHGEDIGRTRTCDLCPNGETVLGMMNASVLDHVHAAVTSVKRKPAAPVPKLADLTQTKIND